MKNALWIGIVALGLACAACTPDAGTASPNGTGTKSAQSETKAKGKVVNGGVFPGAPSAAPAGVKTGTP